jgi:hypothetical protein
MKLTRSAILALAAFLIPPMAVCDAIDFEYELTKPWDNPKNLDLPSVPVASTSPSYAGTNIPIILRTLQETKSGLALCRCILSLAYYKTTDPANLSSSPEIRAWIDETVSALPAPDREALREYFGEFLFYDFQPELFWPHYPDDWMQGMRSVLRHAMLTGYDIRNLNHAVAVAPLFFTNEQIGEVYDLMSILKAGNCVSPMKLRYRLHGPHKGLVWPSWAKLNERGYRFWIEGVWSHADAERKEELVECLYYRPLTFSWDDRLTKPAEETLCTTGQMDDFLPVREWLQSRPDKLRDLLRDEDRNLRQYTLRYALRKDAEGRRLVDPSDPDIIGQMLDGLRNDGIDFNHRMFPGILAEAADHSLPAMRKTFLETGDMQQKMTLAHIFVKMRDEEIQPQLLEFLYGVMAAMDREGFYKRNPGYIGDYGAGMHATGNLWYSPRTRWATQRMVWLEERARDFLLAKLPECNDPQQAALSIFALDKLGGLQSIDWNDRLIETLARGMEDNDIEHDLGFCAGALKLGKEAALESLLRCQGKSQVPQREVAIEILSAYAAGDLETYYNLRGKYDRFVSKNWGNKTDPRYWEYSFYQGRRDTLPTRAESPLMK